MTIFPTQTPEYLAAKETLAKIYADARAPHWKRYCDGEINHHEYCDLIDEAYVTYVNALEPYWVKAGGCKNPKSKTRKQLQTEYDEKWRKPENKGTQMNCPHCKRNVGHLSTITYRCVDNTQHTQSYWFCHTCAYKIYDDESAFINEEKQ